MANLKIIKSRTINREVLKQRIALRRKQDLERLAAMPPLNPIPPQTKSSGPATISVVGNAQSLFENKYGNIIDDADIVIRFNSGFIVDPEVQGSKTTTVVHSQYLSRTDRKKWLAQCSSVQFWNTQRWTERETLLSQLSAKPSNGLIVLEHIKINFPGTVIRLFGFDWKQSKTWYHEIEPEICKHNYNAERKYCMKLIDEMGWELYR